MIRVSVNREKKKKKKTWDGVLPVVVEDVGSGTAIVVMECNCSPPTDYARGIAFVSIRDGGGMRVVTSGIEGAPYYNGLRERIEGGECIVLDAMLSVIIKEEVTRC